MQGEGAEGGGELLGEDVDDAMDCAATLASMLAFEDQD